MGKDKIIIIVISLIILLIVVIVIGITHKNTYKSSNIPVIHTITNDAMTNYFKNINTWLDKYDENMNTNFSNNNCSLCNEDNSCNKPNSGTYCDQSKEFDTGLKDDLNVYLYINNKKDDKLVTYVTSSNGKINNMIPGITYYFESKKDNSKYGVVTASGERRTLATSVRNLRDLGGLKVSYEDLETKEIVSGSIIYGRLYRSADITSDTGIEELTKLGITKEIELRKTNNEGLHMSNYVNLGITNYHINPTETEYLTEAHLDNYRELKNALRKTMLYIINGDNVLFHCTLGADRTGTLAYFLEGLLGVSLEDRLSDYELTYFYGLQNRTRFHNYLEGSNINPRFESMYKSYPTNEDIYNFYKYEETEVGTDEYTDDELLTKFREVMINKNK